HQIPRRLAELVEAEPAEGGLLLPYALRQLKPAVGDLEIGVVALGRRIIPVPLARDQQRAYLLSRQSAMGAVALRARRDQRTGTEEPPRFGQLCRERPVRRSVRAGLRQRRVQRGGCVGPTAQAAASAARPA